MRLVLAAALLLSTLPAVAAEPAADSTAWLQRIATAARTLNYSGIFVYQHGSQVDTSRIVHYVDATGNETEKLESLDGPAREVIRSNDEVKCYQSDSKTVWIEKRRPAKSFPALLPENLGTLTENYTIRLGGHDRVAGLECQVLVLEPKDGMRYGHKLWADVATGLLVKSVMMDDRGKSVEQFAFTQVNVGGPIDKDLLRSSFATVGKDWHEDRPAQAVAADSGWQVNNQPPGFKKIMEMRRTLPGKSEPVAHIVLSDGLAAVSVFIEPMPSGDHRPVMGISKQGAINVFTRPVADQLVTVVGEAPASTVMQIGNSVAPRVAKP
jgi:sigma-E factor negative regulatory protein RseB